LTSAERDELKVERDLGSSTPCRRIHTGETPSPCGCGTAVGPLAKIWLWGTKMGYESLKVTMLENRDRYD